MQKGCEPIIVNQSFQVPISVVWDALSNIKTMTKWYFDNIPDCKPEVGFETKFKVHNEGRTFTHLWNLTEVVLDKTLKYNWTYNEYTGHSFVKFELTPIENGTHLKVTCEVLESFPTDIPEFKRESCQAGWNYFILERLTTFLVK